MDELALLRGFRSEDALPGDAREQALTALAAAVTRERRRRRGIFVALAVVGAAMLAGAAYAVVDRLIVGAPAPREVRKQNVLFGHGGELIPVPHPDDPQLAKARVAAVLDSTRGSVYLFSSPTARGICASEWLQGDRGYQGRLNMATVCGSATVTFWAYSPSSHLLFGRAANPVARIRLQVAGRTVTVPLVGRWFLLQLPSHPQRLISYRPNGRLFENQSYHSFAAPNPPPRPPHQVTRMRELTRLQAETGETITLLTAKANNGGYCQSVRSNRRASNFGCGMPLPNPDQIAVAAISFGGKPGGVLLLVGPVGTHITTLHLRYQDGRQRHIPLHQRWALYEISRNDHKQGRRPETLTGQDTTGRTVTSIRLPWARR